MKIKPIHAFLLLVFILVFAWLWSMRDRSMEDRWENTYPDNSIRRIMAVVKPDAVARVKLSLWGRMGRSEVVVTDRAIIEQLTEGLQEARDTALCNRVCRITLVMKDGKQIDPFHFTTEREIDAFSPKFVAGLRAAGVEVPWRRGSR